MWNKLVIMSIVGVVLVLGGLKLHQQQQTINLLQNERYAVETCVVSAKYTTANQVANCALRWAKTHKMAPNR